MLPVLMSPPERVSASISAFADAQKSAKRAVLDAILTRDFEVRVIEKIAFQQRVG
jgi:hypothetical protein